MRGRKTGGPRRGRLPRGRTARTCHRARNHFRPDHYDERTDTRSIASDQVESKSSAGPKTERSLPRAARGAQVVMRSAVRKDRVGARRSTANGKRYRQPLPTARLAAAPAGSQEDRSRPAATRARSRLTSRVARRAGRRSARRADRREAHRTTAPPNHPPTVLPGCPRTTRCPSYPRHRLRSCPRRKTTRCEGQRSIPRLRTAGCRAHRHDHLH